MLTANALVKNHSQSSPGSTTDRQGKPQAARRTLPSHSDTSDGWWIKHWHPSLGQWVRVLEHWCQDSTSIWLLEPNPSQRKLDMWLAHQWHSTIRQHDSQQVRAFQGAARYQKPWLAIHDLHYCYLVISYEPNTLISCFLASLWYAFPIQFLILSMTTIIGQPPSFRADSKQPKRFRYSHAVDGSMHPRDTTYTFQFKVCDWTCRRSFNKRWDYHALSTFGKLPSQWSANIRWMGLRG